MRDRLDRWADPPLLVLASLAEEPRHGYAITQDIADTMGVRLSAGTLYAVISRLESRGLIEPLENAEQVLMEPLASWLTHAPEFDPEDWALSAYRDS